MFLFLERLAQRRNTAAVGLLSPSGGIGGGSGGLNGSYNFVKPSNGTAKNGGIVFSGLGNGSLERTKKVVSIKEEDETDFMTPEKKKSGDVPPAPAEVVKLRNLQEDDEDSDLEESTDRDPLMGNGAANNNKVSVAVNSGEFLPLVIRNDTARFGLGLG